MADGGAVDDEVHTYALTAVKQCKQLWTACSARDVDVDNIAGAARALKDSITGLHAAVTREIEIHENAFVDGEPAVDVAVTNLLRDNNAKLAAAGRKVIEACIRYSKGVAGAGEEYRAAIAPFTEILRKIIDEQADKERVRKRAKDALRLTKEIRDSTSPFVQTAIDLTETCLELVQFVERRTLSSPDTDTNRRLLELTEAVRTQAQTLVNAGKAYITDENNVTRDAKHEAAKTFAVSLQNILVITSGLAPGPARSQAGAVADVTNRIASLGVRGSNGPPPRPKSGKPPRQPPTAKTSATAANNNNLSPNGGGSPKPARANGAASPQIARVKSQRRSSRPLPPPPLEGCSALAVHNYLSDFADDLSFPAGATIIGVELTPDPNWLKGCYENKSGLFPANHVELKGQPGAVGSNAADNMVESEAGGSGGGEASNSAQSPVSANVGTATPAAGSVAVSSNTGGVAEKAAAVEEADVWARAEFKFKGEVGELSFDVGMIIQKVVVVDDSGLWYEGELGGKVGMFPANHVVILSEEEVAEMKKKEGKSTQEEAVEGAMARAVHPFNAEAPDELGFKLDDIITNVLVADEGGEWYMGECNGQKGMFPANHVELLTEEEEAAVKNNQQSGVACVALHPFKGEAGELTFAKDAIIFDVLVVDDAGNWYEGELNGKRGLFPSNHVEVLPEDDPRGKKKVGPAKLSRTVKAVADFKAVNLDELGFKIGDKITDVTVVDENWLYGTLNQKQGIFPASFVEDVAAESKLPFYLLR